ncbi:receptor expression enhancing protein A isoform X2 [Musca autumnalis]|uniref:receptor expression enhancing protein A isoform X2 n=1 Tax=Musca autumnalis TaxID=221902 RepID=UPI003CEF139E
MYHNDFYSGSTNHQREPRQKYVYRTHTNRKTHVIRPDRPKYYHTNDVVIEDRRHSLGAGPDESVYEQFRPGVVYTTSQRHIENDMAHSSYRRYSDNDEYIDESFVDQEEVSEVIDTNNVVRNLTTFGRFLEMLQGMPLPRLSLTTSCIFFLIAIFISPRPCAQNIIFPAFRLSFGTLYPAYASYKAVRTKNVKEYVKWMMYWIVCAFFTCTETFTDIFLSWFPFYYEVKVVIVLWLLSPATKGSSTLYRKFVHPMLTRREQEIDEYLNQAKERGYSAVLQLGSKGVNYATNVIMQTAIKGGGNLVQTIRRSYSLSDLSEPDIHRTQDEVDDVAIIRPQQRMLRPRLNTPVGRSASGTRHSTGMYFTEVDVTSKGTGDFNYNIRSSDDISSGYSSAEPIAGGLSRTSSMTNASKTRLKAKRSEDKMSTSCTTLPRSKKAEKSLGSMTTAAVKTRSSRHEK